MIIRLPRLECNAYVRGRYYCPEAKWLMKDPCPFLTRRECENYREMCGVIK